MGTNAILVFVFAQSDASLDTAITWFYTDRTSNNLYNWYKYDILYSLFGNNWGNFLWAITKIISWLCISVGLYKYL